MIKFFRKIRQRLLTENKFGKYLIYASGILIAISFLALYKTDKHGDVSGTLDLGVVNFNPKSYTCETSKCYKFTSSSSQVFETKTGVLRIDEPEGDLIGTIVMYTGGNGNFFYSEKKSGNTIIEESLKKGYRVIQIKWNEGWFKGSKEKREGFRKLAVHPASITQYIFDNLVERDKPFILFGSSGGAAQIAYMLSFYGIDSITDKAIIFAGFWMGRLDIGCFDSDPLNSQLHYSKRARTVIDQSLGFNLDAKGPCELRDTTYYEVYKNSSISHGGRYYYPNTSVYLIYGGNDEVGALNQGLTYYEKLASAGSPYVHMQIVEGAGHGILRDSLGFETIRKILFTEVDYTTNTNNK
jgi:hypothetical protein